MTFDVFKVELQRVAVAARAVDADHRHCWFDPWIELHDALDALGITSAKVRCCFCKHDVPEDTTRCMAGVGTQCKDSAACRGRRLGSSDATATESDLARAKAWVLSRFDESGNEDDWTELARIFAHVRAEPRTDYAPLADLIEFASWVAHHPDIGDSLTAATREVEIQSAARRALGVAGQKRSDRHE